MAVPSDGSYGVPEGVLCGFPGHAPRAAATRSSRGSRSTISRASGSMRPPASWSRSARRCAGSDCCVALSVARGTGARRRSAALPAVAASVSGGVPAAIALVDLAVLLEARQHAVEIVLLDAHRARDLGNRDPGLGLDELECLQRARAGATRTSAPAAARGLRARVARVVRRAVWRRRPRRARRAGARAACGGKAGERRRAAASSWRYSRRAAPVHGGVRRSLRAWSSENHSQMSPLIRRCRPVARQGEMTLNT